jgi:hypothetical protein
MTQAQQYTDHDCHLGRAILSLRKTCFLLPLALECPRKLMIKKVSKCQHDVPRMTYQER